MTTTNKYVNAVPNEKWIWKKWISTCYYAPLAIVQWNINLKEMNINLLSFFTLSYHKPQQCSGSYCFGTDQSCFLNWKITAKNYLQWTKCCWFICKIFLFSSFKVFNFWSSNFVLYPSVKTEIEVERSTVSKMWC